MATIEKLTSKTQEELVRSKRSFEQVDYSIGESSSSTSKRFAMVNPLKQREEEKINSQDDNDYAERGVLNRSTIDEDADDHESDKEYGEQNTTMMKIRKQLFQKAFDLVSLALK